MGNALQKSYNGAGWESEKVHLMSDILSNVMEDV